MRYEFIKNGEFVFHQGDYGDKFYIMIKGRVQVLSLKEEYLKLKKEERIQKQKMKEVQVLKRSKTRIGNGGGGSTPRSKAEYQSSQIDASSRHQTVNWSASGSH